MSDPIERTLRTATTSAATANVTMTMADLQRVVDDLAKLLGAPEPFADYMRDKGFPPEAGWVLLLPARWADRELLPIVLPSYVKLSQIIDGVLIINASTFTKP